MRITHRPVRPLVGLSAALLVFTACGSGGDEAVLVDDDLTTTDGAGTDPAVESTESPSTEPESSVDTAPEPVEAEPEPVATVPAPVDSEPVPVDTEPAPVETEPAADESGPGGSLPDCLVGDWIVNDDEMNAYYMALGQNSGAGLNITADGNMLITMTETDYLFTGDYSVDIDVGGITGTGIATGTANGTWTVVDGVIQSALTDSDLAIQVTVGGISFDGSDIGNSLLRTDPFANTPVSCDGPTLMFQAGATEDVRHPVVLTPA